ncbi:testis-expressed protein 13D-like [Rousettus aegyptiacus]|uniref:testis-expressed protein 13D-like n=1 Tax=Rousettus aegyptiacus TaxID=9407 RepID=UPI00168D013C|nr:testis-expressed protein 13D-like [Rousettus aegyptiacus]
MAVDLGDARSGFRHSEIVLFINEEVLSNGGCPDFYLTFCSRPWNEIEDKLLSIIADPQVPRAVKRACTWSALALSVRVAARQREQQAHRVRRLQEQVEERETAAWALASQLQRLRKERDMLVSQLRRMREDLQQTLDDREALRRQLLQAEKQSREVVPESRPQRLGYDVWPLNADERNKVLAEMRQRRKDADFQRESTQIPLTTGVLHVPGPQNPWAQVVHTPLPVPYPTPFPAAISYPAPPAPTVVTETDETAGPAFPPQMPTGMIYPSDMWPAVGSQEEIAPQPDQRNQGQEEVPVRPHFINSSGHSQSKEDPRKQQPQGQVPTLPKGKETFEY